MKNKVSSKLMTLIIKAGPLLGVLAGLLLGAVFVIIWGGNPLSYAQELWRGSFGNISKIGVTINRATPLLISATGTAIAFRAGAYNIGQEGQLFLGGLGAVLVGLVVKNMPAAIGIPLVLLGGIAFGAFASLIAALLKLFRGVNEILSTLLINFVCTFFTSFMVAGPIRDISSSGYPQSPLMPENLRLTVWKEYGFIHSGVFVALLCALLFGYILWSTPFGFRLRMTGISPKATQTAGYNPKKMFLFGMLISGGLSGLAGAIEVTGIYNRLIYGFGTNIGFDSLSVALLGTTNPFTVIPAALFFGALRAGTTSMQRAIGVPSVLLQLIQGSIILFIVISFALKENKSLLRRLLEPKVDDDPNTAIDDESQSETTEITQ